MARRKEEIKFDTKKPVKETKKTKVTKKVETKKDDFTTLKDVVIPGHQTDEDIEKQTILETLLIDFADGNIIVEEGMVRADDMIKIARKIDKEIGNLHQLLSNMTFIMEATGDIFEEEIFKSSKDDKEDKPTDNKKKNKSKKKDNKKDKKKDKKKSKKKKKNKNKFKFLY